MENNKQNAILFIYKWVDDNVVPDDTGKLSDMLIAYGNKLNISDVSGSLPVDYLQTEMIKAIKELAKESTAPDKDTPAWLENDIKRGMQWMHKRLTGNDC